MWEENTKDRKGYKPMKSDKSYRMNSVKKGNNREIKKKRKNTNL